MTSGFWFRGPGPVGAALARILGARGGILLVDDVDTAKARALVDELRASGVEAQVAAPDVDADLFCPCALGGSVDEQAVRFELVCGSANLQLARPEVAEILHREGTLFVPECAVNAGAVIQGIVRHTHGEAGARKAAAMIRATDARVAELLYAARAAEVSPSRRFEEVSGGRQT